MKIFKPSPEKITVLDTEVLFLSDKPEYPEVEKEFESNLNFVTIASAYSKDILIEDYQFTGSTVIIDYLMHRLIKFDLPSMSLKELIWNISKIYVEIFKSYKKEAKVCCSGYEFLYLKKIRVHKNNTITLEIRHKNDGRKDIS